MQTNDNKVYTIRRVHKKNVTGSENKTSIWKITTSISTCTEKSQEERYPKKVNGSTRQTNTSFSKKKKKSPKHLNKRTDIHKKSEKHEERNKLGVVRFSEDVISLIKQIENGRLTLDEVLAMGILPLHEAVARNMLESTRTLLQLGADMNRETAEGMTPLQVAVFCGCFDTAKLLIQHGASIDRIRDGIQVF